MQEKADLTATDLWPLRVMYSIIGTRLIDELITERLIEKMSLSIQLRCAFQIWLVPYVLKVMFRRNVLLL